MATPVAAPVAPTPSAGTLGLELADVNKQYGEITALRDCSFAVRPGRVLGLLGPNGAGKTTAMRCIFGLVTPERGEVLWNQGPVDGQTRLRFGYMPEERGLYLQMRVRDQLEYFARLSGLDAQAAGASVGRWLQRLGLRERGEDRVSALSHGNQQRVQLAAALVHDPLLLVLDEPFSGLDPLGVDALSVVLSDLAAAGTAILFSSHQLDLVEDVCDDVVVVDHGCVVVRGELDELRAAASLRYLTVAFRGTETWKPAIEGARVLAAEPGHTRMSLSVDADVADLATRAERAGEVTRFSLEPPTLSDLFREAVTG